VITKALETTEHRYTWELLLLFLQS
jgi:hypothetical protein